MTTYRIDKTGGNGQSVQVTRQYAQNLQVQIFDIDTIPPTPITGGTMQFQNTNNLVTQPAATFAGGAGSENQPLGPGGFATSSRPTANNVAGKVSIRAWIGGAQTVFTLTNKTPSGAATASGIGTGAGTDQVVLQGGGPGIPLTAIVTDQYDAAFPGASVTWTLPSSGASGTFTVGGGTSATSTTDASGIATCPAFIANSQLGPWIVSARVTADSTLTVDFPITTNPASGTEVCTAATIPSSSVVVFRPGASTSWVNPQNWPATSGAVAQNFYGTIAIGEISNNLYASGLAAAVAAIPDGAEITRVTFSQQVRNGTTGGCQIKMWLENTAFVAPKITTDSVFTPAKNNTFAVNTANWTTFTTPNPGSKLLGIDVKNAGFRIGLFNTFTGGVLEAGTLDLKLLTLTICYLAPDTSAGAGALQFCEV